MIERSPSPRILVVDDDQELRTTLCELLADQGFGLSQASAGRQALEEFAKLGCDAVLLDLQLPDADGVTVLADMVRSRPDVPVLIITGHGSVAHAVEAIKAGAHDFMEKPLDTERLLITVRNALASRTLRLERDGLLEHLREEYGMTGSSAALERIRAAIDRVAPSGATVLITGETGVGKELVSRAIYAHSARASKPFVSVNCAAIPEELIESELFGHVKGAFTGAAVTKKGKFHRAHGGTIFLDEVADMSPRAQAKVLRAIETGEVEMVGATQPEVVDVRILAATNRDLAEAVASGVFRKDLYYRLNAVRIDIPPLRDRGEDIVSLAAHFMQQFSGDHNIRQKALDPSAKNALLAHSWPGNVRELRNLAERLTLMVDHQLLDASDIAAALAATGVKPVEEPRTPEFWEAVRGFERELLARTLVSHDWKVTEAADALGLTPANLYKKLSFHGISRP